MKRTKNLSAHSGLAKIAFVGFAIIWPGIVSFVSGQAADPNTCPTSRVENLLGTGTINNLFIFTDGNAGANWQGASKGYLGDVVVDGIQADETTSGAVPYAGIINTNAPTLGAWQDIVAANVGQANRTLNNASLVSQMQTNVTNAITTINGMPVTPGFNNRLSTSLNGLNTQNGLAETIVIDVTSGFTVSSQINITGDTGDLFILRWDTDENFANGFHGQVKFQSGGAIVPLGGLTPGNFINVAGNLSSSGGGSNPPLPYPQGPRFNNGTGGLINGGTDWVGGGFFTGYWLTTGEPTALGGPGPIFVGPTGSLSNAIFVGGWYTMTTEFSITGGTSGINVGCQTLEVTAAPADISGQIVTDAGRAIYGARITLTDLSTGESRSSLSNPFGYFAFNDLTIEHVYLLNVSHKQYTFGNNPRLFTLTDSLSDLQIVAVSSEAHPKARRQ